jgi:hypothetical protein
MRGACHRLGPSVGNRASVRASDREAMLEITVERAMHLSVLRLMASRRAHRMLLCRGCEERARVGCVDRDVEGGASAACKPGRAEPVGRRRDQASERRPSHRALTLVRFMTGAAPKCH